jgi:hypothetical protein
MFSSTGAQISIQYPQTMTKHTPLRQNCVATETGAGINGLIAACNKNDRFKLLEDDSVLPGNLDNLVHPTFRSFDSDGPMRQMLQLASHFISHDTLLAFFVPLLYGRELTSMVGHVSKTFLSDPLAGVSEEKRGQYLAGVREALHCIGHSVSFHFRPPAKRVFARTMRDAAKPNHATSCCPAFQRQYSCKIELADCFRDYYVTGEYQTASRCAQFRHDFLFATTLVHEMVHAVGVLRRGNLKEPHIRADCPETEWGYGWEHFMFGCVVNPQDKAKPGTHILMRKVWADQTLADKAGGKEYCDVPMSYVAQWFRKETWCVIAERGPAAIAAPTTHFKIQSSNQYEAWIVTSDSPGIKRDLETLHSQWMRHTRRSSSQSGSSSLQVARLRSLKILWKLVTTAQLQRDNVPVPLRPPPKSQTGSTRVHKLTHTIPVYYKPTKTLRKTKRESVNLRCSAPSISDRVSRKRRAGSREDCGRINKARMR